MPDTRVESIRLADGQRVFRVLDPETGLCLERVVDPFKPVRPQTERLVETLQALRSLPGRPPPTWGRQPCGWNWRESAARRRSTGDRRPSRYWPKS